MIDPVNDLLYNIIHYTLSLSQDVSPLNYSNDSCSFSILDPVNCKSELTLKDISNTLDQISTIDYIYPLEDPRSVFIDQSPTLVSGVLRYNPIGKLPPISNELWAIIRQKINTLSASKKSRSLKYNLS